MLDAEKMLDARYWMEQCEVLNIKRTGRLELDTGCWMELHEESEK
jgi:hypothetical protein